MTQITISFVDGSVIILRDKAFKHYESLCPCRRFGCDVLVIAVRDDEIVKPPDATETIHVVMSSVTTVKIRAI